jgi:hypothetical protein
VTANQSADQVTVESGGALVVNAGVTLTLAGAITSGTDLDVQVGAVLEVNGIVSGGDRVPINVAGTGTVHSGGIIRNGGGNGANADASPYTISGTLTMDCSTCRDPQSTSGPSLSTRAAL